MAESMQIDGARCGNPMRIAVWGTAAFLLVWVNLAVGMIGDDGDPANLLFGGVLVVGIAEAAIGRFRHAGMMRTLASGTRWRGAPAAPERDSPTRSRRPAAARRCAGARDRPAPRRAHRDRCTRAAARRRGSGR